MSRIVVDFGLCEANGVCMGIIPEVFDLDEEDYLQNVAGFSHVPVRKLP